MNAARIAALAAVAGMLALQSTPAAAQTAPVPPPIRNNIDENGVDLVTLGFNVSTTEVVIGVPGAGGMAYSRSYYGAWIDDYNGYLSAGPTLVTLGLGRHSESFNVSGSTYTLAQGQGSTLAFNSSTQTYTLTGGDGTVSTFVVTSTDGGSPPSSVGHITKLTRPNGETLTFNYVSAMLCTVTCNPTSLISRLQSVTNNFGYQMRFNYAIGGNQVDYNSVGPWQDLVGVTGINMAVDYCDPLAQSCPAFTVAWPSVAFARPDSSTSTSTDSLNRVTKYIYANNLLTGIRKPSSPSTNSLTINYESPGSTTVASITNGVGTWTYTHTEDGAQRTTKVQDPMGNMRTVVGFPSVAQVSSETNGAGKTTTYGYDIAGRITRITFPESGAVEYQYDTRGNLTRSCQIPKTRVNYACDPAQGDIATIAHFPATCSPVVLCNRPDYTLDELGHRTDYTYDSTHGGVLTITAPVPQPGAVQPKVSNTYTALYAWYKNASGTMVQAPTPVYQLTQVNTCATAATCAGGTDEVRSTFSYGSDGVANNRLSTSITRGNGAGTLTATTTLNYDAVGNVSSTVGPLQSSAATTSYRYDPARRRVGTYAPDPAGTKFRAARVTYDVDDHVTAVEQGTVPDTTDNAWQNNFTVLAKQTATYDALGRNTQSAAIAVPGTTAAALTQYSYDNANRLQCIAVRMNPSLFGSLPSACSLSTPQGSDGPDRITYYTYDGASRILKQIIGYGTATPINAVTLTYTDDGLRSTLADGAGHLSTFEYDEFDRLKKLHYPKASDGSTSSTTDYELFTYDVASNVKQITRRDTQTITLDYDALNRLHGRTPPAAADALTYSYDNLGRLLSAVTPGQSLSFTYDALSRMINQVGPEGTWISGWDASGRRTKLTWPDGFFVNYDYDTLNQLTKVRENNATSGLGMLASFAYDDLGRRKTLSRGNGVNTSYGYDTLSRLTSLTNDLSGTTNDQSYSFTYGAGSQVTNQTTTNATYDWNGTPPTGTYGANGLNQLTTSGGTLQYADARGNLTSDGTKTFGFDSLNRLTSASGTPAATLSYDPADRLYQTSGATTTRFAYDGDNLAGEYATGSPDTLLRRYVYGPQTDEPLVWYEGSGTTSRRWMVADPRGSVTAVTDTTGAATQIDRYDDYGVPGAANPGRFQYTGQMWIPEVGLYSYKARMYHPTLGRFLQTDPAGYGAGTNLYAYAGGDPINNRDPSGLSPCILYWTSHPGGGGGIDGLDVVVGGYPDTLSEFCPSDLIDDGGAPGGGGGGGGGSTGPQGQQSWVCNQAKDAFVRHTALIPGGPTVDSRLERQLVSRYADGIGGTYHLSDSDFAILRDTVAANPVLLGANPMPPGFTGNHYIFMGKTTGRFDIALGTATGIFANGTLVGVRDIFDFDNHPITGPGARSNYGVFAAMIEADVLNIRMHFDVMCPSSAPFKVSYP
jgi:RHS repeat-associated protein